MLIYEWVVCCLLYTSISINHLALQVAWLLTALFIGRKLFGLLGAYIPFFNELPSVLHGIFGGAILWQLLKMTKLERYVDLKTIKMASGFCLEITVFTAMATLDTVSYTHLDVYKRQQ